MIKKIKKIENWYGISKIDNPEIILSKNNSIIYAENGTMKSSFAKGFYDLSLGLAPEDKITLKKSEYVIDDDATTYNDKLSKQIDGIIVFPYHIKLAEENLSDPDNDGSQIYDLKELLADSELMKEYQKQKQLIEESYKKICIFLADIFIGSTSLTPDAINVINSFLSRDKLFFSENNIISTTTNSIKLFYEILEDDSNYDSTIDKVSVCDIFINDDIVNLFKDEKNKKIISECANKYREIEKNISDEFIPRIGHNININNLEQIHKSLQKNNFFNEKKERKINFCNIQIDKLEDFDSLLQELNKKIYTDKNFKEKYENFEKLINRNKNRRKLNDFLKSHQKMISYLDDIVGLIYKIIYMKLRNKKLTILEEFKKIEAIKNEINKIRLKASKNKTRWQNVIDIFNQRFANNIFEFEIENKIDAMLDQKLSFPILVEKRKKIDLQSDRETFFNTLSESERKSLMFLHLLYAIECARINNKKTTIIFDDLFDSFDYKNKYAILFYLAEILQDNNFNLIFLTHNFDFFRSLIFIFNSYNVEYTALIAKRDLNGIVKFNDDSIQNFQDYGYIKEWKQKDACFDKQFKRFTALIPFCRNLCQIKYSTRDNRYINLCKFIHFSPDDEVKICDIKNEFFEFLNINLEEYIVEKNKFNAKFYDSMTDIYQKLKSELKKSKPNSLGLCNEFLNKMFISQWIRIFSEKMIYCFWINEIKPPKNEIEEIKGNKRWQNKLIEKLNIHDCWKKSRQKNIYERSKIISPPFSHVNSFMFEPLIDMNINELLIIAEEIEQKLS